MAEGNTYKQCGCRRDDGKRQREDQDACVHSGILWRTESALRSGVQDVCATAGFAEKLVVLQSGATAGGPEEQAAESTE